MNFLYDRNLTIYSQAAVTSVDPGINAQPLEWISQMGEVPRARLGAAFIILLAMCLATAAQAQDVSIAFNSIGLSSLNYNGTQFLNYGDLRVDQVELLNPNGSITNPSTSSTVVVDPVNQLQTRTYSWGQIVVKYTVLGNRLSIAVTITNTSGLPMQGIWYESLGLQFPSAPAEFGCCPLLVNTIGSPAVQSMSYSDGVMVAAVDDVTLPLQIGFPGSRNGLANTIFPLDVNTDTVFMYPNSLPVINRTIAAGASDMHHFSLRFGPVGSTTLNLAPDTYQAFAAAFPPTLNWSDRRPMGMLVLATPSAGWPTNPRGWFSDPTVDVTTPAGIAVFQARVLAYANNAVSILQSLNAQAAITWDIEGEQYDSITYVGDPTLLPTLAPEMDPIADQYFQIFTNAGIKVGVTLRPQMVSFATSPPQQTSLADPTQDLITKVQYAQQRWGTTLFYIDSNVISNTNPNATPASIFATLQAMFPGSLFIPTHSVDQYWAYAAPYMQLNQGHTGTSPQLRAMYPNSFTVLSVIDGPVAQNYTILENSVAAGDTLLFRVRDDDEPTNRLVKSIYSALSNVSVFPSVTSLTSGQTQQFMATVASSTSTAVTWTLSPSNGSGFITPGGLYTAPASIASQQTVTIMATSVMNTAMSASATVTLSPIVTTLAPTAVSMNANQTQQFTPAVTGSSNTAVTGSLNPSTGSGSVAAGGLYTAPASITTQQTNPKVSVSTIGVAVTIGLPNAPYTIGCIGDSITNGYTSSPPVDPCAIAASDISTYSGITWSPAPANEGIIGSRTGDWVSGSGYLSIAISNFTAEGVNYVLIMLGTNDASIAAGETSPATYQSNLQSTIAALKAAGFNKIMLSYSPYNWAGTVSNTDLVLYQTAILNLVSADPTHVFLGDTQTYSFFQDNPGDLSDGTHPNNAGYAVLGQLWATAFQSNFIPSGSLRANQTVQLIATVTGTSNTGVTWSILNGGPGSISGSGVYTAPPSIITQQTVTVQAMSLADNTKTATATITLNPPVAITLAPTTISLNASQTQQFTPTVIGSSNTAVTWSLSPSTGSGSVTAGGLYTAPASITTQQTVTITATSVANSAVSGSATITLNPPVAITATTAVNLSSAYNRLGMVTDGFSFTGGLDGYGNCYSANLLGSTVVFNGTSLTLGSADAPDAVTSAIVALPAGQFSTMTMLATGLNGNQVSQTFTVNYTDGTSTPFLQSFSDWYTPQRYPGEGVAVTVAYRDTSSGTEDPRTFDLYGYSFAINGAKTVKSVTLPANSNVMVLAITLTAGSTVVSGTVDLSPTNRLGIVRDGFPCLGGLDGGGNCYSANLLGSAVVFNGTSLTLGSAGAPDAVTSAIVALPAGQFSTMTMLATGVNGNQVSQNLTVNYTDGTSTSFVQSFSDWYTPQGYPGEGVASTMAYRDTSYGTEDPRTFDLYGYSFALNGAKTVQSVTLPANSNVVVLAVTLTAGSRR